MMQIVFQAAAAIIALTAAIMAWRLERRLVRLRSGQDAMHAAAAALTEAVARAEASVRALRAEGADAAQELEGMIGRARAASDELRLLNAAPRRAGAPRPAPDPTPAPAPAAARPANIARLRTPATWDIDADDEPAAQAPRLPEPTRATGTDLMERLRRVR